MKKEDNYRFIDSVSHRFPEVMAADLAARSGDFYRVRGDTPSVEMSIKKMDKPRSVLFKEDPLWLVAKELFHKLYTPLFAQTRALSLDEIYADVAWTKAAGLPWKMLGFSSKDDCFRSEWVMDFVHNIKWILQNIPLWRIVDKTEWLSLEDIMRGKVRTFIIPPFHLFYWCKMMFGSQNEAVKRGFWSAYGFNPYAGGVDAMARRLLKFRTKLTYDVKGWDRVLPILRTIYSFRLRFIEDGWLAVAVWCARNCCESYLVHPNGTVFFKKMGNNSGSVGTTPDNIMGHVLILLFTLLHLYGGDQHKVLAAIAFLFGDDAVMSLPDPPDGVDIELTFRHCFGCFGLELDPFCLTETLEGQTFLGFTFHYNEEYKVWVPRYNKDRLFASFYYSIERQQEFMQLSRMWSLMVMSAGNGREIFDVFRHAVKYALKTSKDDHPTSLALQAMGVPTYHDCMVFFAGLEGNSSIMEKFPILHVLMEDGGIKHEDEYYYCEWQEESEKTAWKKGEGSQGSSGCHAC